VSPDDEYHRFELEIDQWRIRRKDADDRKSYDEVFDQQNLLRIYKLFTDGVLDRLDFPISTGKEGNVFRATTPDEKLVAVKIYRTTTSTFRDMAKYVQGDPRFKGLAYRKRRLILAWAYKEYLNLRLFVKAGVRVPKPIAHLDNIVVMEYIGDENAPAAEMRVTELEDPKGISEKILGYVKAAYQKGELVHADLSEFNILMHDSEPVIIDVGQAVMLGHPLAEEWLQRDIGNMARFFKKYNVRIDVKAALEEIKKE
jgi:RIO kinase 1